MATSQEIIDRATSLLRVRTSGVTFSTDDANKNADVFIAFKNMLNEFGEDGLVNIPEPASLTDTLDIPAGSVRGLAYNLAVEVAAEFGLDPTPIVFEIAKETNINSSFIEETTSENTKQDEINTEKNLTDK